MDIFVLKTTYFVPVSRVQWQVGKSVLCLLWADGTTRIRFEFQQKR